MAPLYFAVAIGKKPDLYTDWEDAKKQLDGVPGSQCQTFHDLDSAADYMRQNGNYDPRIHKSAFQRINGFTPSQSIPMREEFKRYAKALRLTIKRDRDSALGTAMHDEIIYHYLPEGLKLNQINKSTGTITLYPNQKLHIYQAMCRQSHKTPYPTIEACLYELKYEAPYVNIVDLIDTCRTGQKLKTFDIWNEFVAYTRRRPVPLSYAKSNEFMAALLQNLGQKPQSQRRAEIKPEVKTEGVASSMQSLPSSKYDLPPMSPISEGTRSPSPCYKPAKTPASSIDTSGAYIKQELFSQHREAVQWPESNATRYLDELEDLPDIFSDDENIATQLSQGPQYQAQVCDEDDILDLISENDFSDDEKIATQLSQQPQRHPQVKIQEDVPDRFSQYSSQKCQQWSQDLGSEAQSSSCKRKRSESRLIGGSLVKRSR